MSKRRDIATIRRVKEYPALTFYLRVYTDPSDHEYNLVNKKSWIEHFDHIIKRHSMGRSLSQRLKRQFSSSVESIFERPTQPGAVIFLSSSFHAVRLTDKAFDPQVYIDDHFYVGPFEAQIKSRPAALLLTLSQHGSALYRATDTKLEKINMPEIEGPMTEALRLDEFSPSKQSHGNRGGGVHGQGGYKDQRKKLLRAYVRYVDSKLKPELKKRRLPLIVFGAKNIVPMYKNTSSYDKLSDEIIVGSPSKLRSSEIHDRVRPLISQVSMG